MKAILIFKCLHVVSSYGWHKPCYHTNVSQLVSNVTINRSLWLLWHYNKEISKLLLNHRIACKRFYEPSLVLFCHNVLTSHFPNASRIPCRLWLIAGDKHSIISWLQLNSRLCLRANVMPENKPSPNCTSPSFRLTTDNLIFSFRKRFRFRDELERLELHAVGECWNRGLLA